MHPRLLARRLPHARAPAPAAVPLGWGTLGFAFPAALGAALADARPVVASSGDGGFLFAAGELATVAQERIPLTAVIVDDGGYGMLRYDQDVAGAEPYGVDLLDARLRRAGAASASRAEPVDGLDDEFGEALAAHVADPEPSVLVARTPGPLVPPPNTSPNWYRQAVKKVLTASALSVPARPAPSPRASAAPDARRRPAFGAAGHAAGLRGSGAGRARADVGPEALEDLITVRRGAGSAVPWRPASRSSRPGSSRPTTERRGA